MKIKDLNNSKLMIFDNFELKVCKDRYIKYINNSIYIYNKQRELIDFNHRFNKGNSLIDNDGYLIYTAKNGNTYSANIVKPTKLDKVDLFWIPKSVIKQAKKEYKILTSH